MKKIFKQILKYYLKFWTKLALLIHRPTIIAVAGSINKSFFRDDIKNILEKEGKTVRANPKNFNTEIGLPLAILYLNSGYNSFSNWLPIILEVPFAAFKKFPDYLVLEFGISNHGDMKYLLSIVKPDITVITNITQKYLEGFDDMNELVGEYEYLIKHTKKDGLVILNYDNARLRELRKNLKQKLRTFAIKNKADWQAIQIDRGVDGQSIKVDHDNVVKEYKIKKFGEHHVYSLLTSLIIKENI